MHIRVFGALGSNVLREARRTPTAWTWTKMAFRFRFPAKGDLCGKDKSSENSVFQTVQGFQQIPSLTGLVVLPHSLFRNSRRSAAASAIARLFKDRSAATAVEFALISIPFFTLLFGIIELGLMFTLNVSLDSAIANFATQVRTGQVQAPGSAATSSSGAQMDLSGAKNAICNNIKLVPLSTCLSQLQLDVRPLSTFQSSSSPAPISGSTFNSTNLCYYSGNAGSIVQITGYYLYSILNPLLLPAFSHITSYTSSGGSASGYFFPIVATQVFKSENYATGSNTGAGC